MTDVEFFTQLHELLLDYEQILVRADVKEIESCTLNVHHFLRNAKNAPLESTGQDIRPIIEQSNLVLERNAALIQEGLLLVNVMMESVTATRPAATGNYQHPHASSQADPQSTSARRYFDAKA